MSIMRLRASSLLRVLGFTAIICIGRGFAAMPWEAPQTQEQMQARDALNQGVQAFKNGQYDEATRQFEHAKALDPSLLNARLYLASALASQYIPGVASEENIRLGQRAIDEYKSVLLVDAGNLSAIDGIGSLLFQMGGTAPINLELFKESKSFHLKHTQIKPQDPEPYYWIGVIDWTLSFRADRELRAQYNKSIVTGKLAEADPLPPVLQVQYASDWGTTIDEGIASLKKAIELKPDYDDAMAYLNLLYRRKADAVAAQFEREQLLEMADDLVEKVKDIKQQRAQAQPQ
jgi:tetratricopeptide (TPR) repeat protein